MPISVPNQILDQARQIHPRFEEKIQSWQKVIEQHGIDGARRINRDHKLVNRHGEKREHIWSTRLNHRYRLFYEVLNGAVRVLRLETHNKGSY